MLPVTDLYSSLVFAENNGLLADLGRLYAGLPEKECAGCAACCTNPPPAAFVEYLNVYRYLREKLAGKEAAVLKRVAEFFFLELADPEQRCPFYEAGSGCLVSPVRPLGCRLFGMLQAPDYEESEKERVARLQAVAALFRTNYGIELPPAVLAARPYCDRREKEGLQQLTGAEAKENKMRLLVLDAGVVAPEPVFQERTFFPLPIHLAMTVLNTGVRAKRVEVTRAFLAGSRELLEKYVGRVAGFRL
uniref:YkgJ family cysteine cluster protein n=1 Tax=Ammonifex degensii TaxID=42838 RepID=A0A7C2IZX3_9THEO